MTARFGNIDQMVNSARSSCISAPMDQDARWAVGQRFEWKWADGTGSGTAIVAATWSDQQMGLSPEAEQYAAHWMKADVVKTVAGPAAPVGEALTFLLGTDERIYLNGKEALLKAV